MLLCLWDFSVYYIVALVQVWLCVAHALGKSVYDLFYFVRDSLEWLQLLSNHGKIKRWRKFDDALELHNCCAVTTCNPHKTISIWFLIKNTIFVSMVFLMKEIETFSHYFFYPVLGSFLIFADLSLTGKRKINECRKCTDEMNLIYMVMACHVCRLSYTLRFHYYFFGLGYGHLILINFCISHET